ncbi:MAG: hypothetical protein OXC18_05535 [Desulfurellaceae bacterium]|nr:hypothetical protein [Desulfurellaceae bacterium]
MTEDLPEERSERYHHNCHPYRRYTTQNPHFEFFKFFLGGKRLNLCLYTGDTAFWGFF